MSGAAAITLSVTVGLALLGYLLTYIVNLRLARRNDVLTRVNRQLAELYGPLLALSEASTRAWQRFRKVYRPNVLSYWDPDPPATPDDERTWRLWMSKVFMPNNFEMERLVIEKTDLIREVEMPACLKDLCAYVAAYKALMTRWEEGDFSQHKSFLNFPGEVLEYAQRAFRDLKKEQARLLRRRS